MTEKQFASELKILVLQLRNDEIDRSQFAERTQELIKHIDKVFNTFEDEELGWAKYWVEEIAYYSIDTVIDRHYDFSAIVENY